MTKTLSLLTIAFVFLTSCSDQNAKFPFEFLDGKIENDNQMQLYSCGDNPSLDTLTLFCSDMKKEFKSGTFHFIVFFDKKENASFPENPLTGGFIEEKPSRHIKAIYTYNNLNVYSKLIKYEKNSWESKPNEIEIN